MAEKYSILFSLSAEEDLNEIYRYISEKLFANQAAGALMDKIEQSIRRLGEYPFSCPIASEITLSRKKYHKLVVDHFIVFYTVDDTEKNVYISRVVYALRAYQNLL